MTEVELHRPKHSALAGADVDAALRSFLFLALVLIIWVSFRPFEDLSVAPQQVSAGGDLANQVGFVSLFLVMTGWVLFHEPARLKPLLRPALSAMLAWFVLSVATSWAPVLSARRLVFALIVMTLAAIALLLPKSIRHFAGLLAAATLVVLALCYLGLVLWPDLAIHQVTDVLEPEHDGSWRGLFPHKNQAGAMMVVFVFVGLFVARMRSLPVGSAIVVLSLVFLVASRSKTSLALLPLVMIVAAFVGTVRRPTLGIIAALGGVAVLNLVSVGSIFFEPVHAALSGLIDASFTGRTDIWQFALDHLMQRPLTGYGFAAFWGTENVVYGMGGSSTWASNATDAHNAYLNLALTLGLPGLALVLVWLLVLPASDFYRQYARTPGDPGERSLATLFLRVWLFGVYASSFESILFQPVGELWFIFLMSVFGLRYLSLSRTAQ
jgi:O-antigen ligase